MSPAVETAAREAGALIGRLDLSADETRLAEKRSELATIGEREREARSELQRLESAIAHFTGPDPQKVAEAILSGLSLQEATKASDSKEELQQRRDALRAALGPIRDRTDALNGEIRELRGRIASQALQAVAPLVDALNAEAKAAAEVLIETHAARKCIATALGAWVDCEAAGRAAADALVGDSKLLPPRTSAETPEAIVKALTALQARCSIVSTPPAAIML